MAGKVFRTVRKASAYARGRRMFLYAALLLVSLAAAACTYQLTDDTLALLTPAPLPGSEPLLEAPSQRYDLLTLPVTVYILDDEEGVRSSARTADEMSEIFAKTNGIWSPAGIEIEVQAIHRVQVPSTSIQAIMDQQFRTFFGAINSDFELPEPSALNAFYVSELGGPNGITPGSGVFFVADEPSVHDERVTSHEIGHILGLYHTVDDTGRLMYPGTNGITLTDEESTVARYFARRIVEETQ